MASTPRIDTIETDNSTQDGRLDVLEAPGDVELYLDSGNGHGSTNTVIRRFSNIRKNTLGANATYVDSATDGMSVTILKAGKYSINYTDGSSLGSGIPSGISLNSSNLTTSIFALTYAQGKRAITNQTYSVNGMVNLGITLHLQVGDIIRVHTTSSVNFTDSNSLFQMSKVGN